MIHPNLEIHGFKKEAGNRILTPTAPSIVVVVVVVVVVIAAIGHSVLSPGARYCTVIQAL